MLEHLKNHPHYDQALKMANNMTLYKKRHYYNHLSQEVL